LSAIIWGLEFGVDSLGCNFEPPTPHMRTPNYCTHSPPTWSCL